MDLSEIGVNPAKKKQFESKGIESVEDLISLVPRRYKDLSKLTGILPSDQISCVQLRVRSVMSKNAGKAPYVLADCEEITTGSTVKVFWFHTNWMYQHLRGYTNKIVTAAGKIGFNETYRAYTMSQPEFFGGKDLLGIYPVYPSISGMSSEYFNGKMEEALSVAAANSELLPRDILDREKEITMPVTLRYVHKPKTMAEAVAGTDRIVLNDLIYFSLHNELNKYLVSNGSQFNIRTLELYNKVLRSLPFTLTEDQDAAVSSMINMARDGRRLNALLQGDVGCGKTVCAALLAAAFVGSGFQVAVMAPTQVLAKQHYETMKEFFSDASVNIAYLDSTLKKKDRAMIVSQIKNGEISFIIGTHACIAKDVEYKNLALTIVDEEHKFGVKQRAAIVEKASSGVHSINMSATPIPRSLAQVVYGDSIQLYTIKTMPKGRKPIITGVAKDPVKVFKFVKSEVGKGHQVYVVCPLIEQSDKMDAKSVEEVSDEYEKVLGPYGVRIATLTGKDDVTTTEDTIRKFSAGDIDVLIATTVIEVGVNVPNATVMVVTNAERFGLSGLHQLRGRVGRGTEQSYCVLQCYKQTEKAAERLDVMCRTTDGFEIAEADLKLRGAGDFLGTQQSGANKYISLMMAYPDRYQKAVRIAKELIDRGMDCCPMTQRVLEERQNDKNG